VLELKAIDTYRGPAHILYGVSLHVDKQEVVCLVGRNGAGKTTTIESIMGFLPLRSGQILLDDEDLARLPPHERAKRGIGFSPEDCGVFPELSVGDNLAFALPARVRGRSQRRARIEQALAEADLSGFADRDPATLSGGQRARVALMRTLLSEPHVLLLDEPFNKLDAQLRHDFRRFVFEHAADRGLPTLLVTHDATDAQAAGGRVIGLARP